MQSQSLLQVCMRCHEGLSTKIPCPWPFPDPEQVYEHGVPCEKNMKAHDARGIIIPLSQIMKQYHFRIHNYIAIVKYIDWQGTVNATYL